MSFIRLCFALIVLLIVVPGQAAVTISDRSPFAQGWWWNPSRSGDGFEIFNTADQVVVGWYTYDESERAIWYTAQGALDTLGTQAWPLMQHRWVNGRYGGYTVVGSLRLTLRHPESADVAWEIRGQRGTWTIQPFIVSGITNEIDHSGTWFDPGNSGWGLTLTEAGDILGGGLATYDASGEPTWVAGFGRGTQTIEYVAYSGACPACAYREPSARSAGYLSFEFQAEAEAIVRGSLSISMAPGVNVDGARVVQLGRPASTRAADRQLASFDSDAALKAFLDAGMLNVRLPSYYCLTICFSAPPAPVPYSPTNLQESGVDEADLVKSDGRFVYIYAHTGSGVRQPVIRIAEVGGDGATLDVRGAVNLASGPDTPVNSAGLFLQGDNLVSVTGGQPYTYDLSPWVVPGSWLRGVTNVEVLNVATPATPVTRWRAEIEGHIVTSRRIGDRLYVVTRFVPDLPGFAYGYPSLAANQQLLAATPLSGLLPKSRINGGEATAAVAASAVYAPPQGERETTADMVLVTMIELGGPRIAQTLAIVGTFETVYASTTSLFVASSRYALRDASGVLLPVEPPYYLTDIHQIRLGSDAMSIVGSASIEGFLGSDVEKAGFRLSDYQGQLRAVTSSGVMWGSNNQNRLTILEPSTISPGLLRTVSYLPNAQRPQSLGKPYEFLYATRFLENRLYAVTFKKIDPLYIVDLAESTDPRIAGQLELPGFSDYLHPLPNDLLLGFGKDARPADVNGDGQFAWYQGLQLTLFDVRDAGQPRQIQSVLMGKRGSDSALLRDHHAFSMLTQADGSGSIGIPARIHDGPTPPYATDWTYYPWLESGLMRFELRGTGAADARLVQMPSLIIQSSAQSSGYIPDSASNEGRSVLFPNGAIYIGNGQFWRQDNAGNTFGPY